MKKIINNWLLLTLILGYGVNTFAQSSKVKFNGVGRSYINTSTISGNVMKNDSITGSKVNNGVNTLDLNFNITPNKTNEIVALARIENKFGGFWGSGLTLSFRQLYLRGIIANVIRYRLGDIYVKNSPYTTYNPIREDSYNEADIFHMYKDWVYYDNFHQKDYWHLQGGHVDFGFTFKSLIKEVLVDGYIARNNSAVILTRPETLYSGAKITLVQSKFFDLTYHYANFFEMQPTKKTGTEFHNPVNTIDFNINLGNEKLKYKLLGELGASTVNMRNDSTYPKLKDNFMDIGAAIEWVPSGLTLKLSYRQVGADFRSAGAQSKRMNFMNNPLTFTQYTNAQINRPISLFDITKDENLYASTITNIMMQYNPKYENTMPYGLATPNRQGVNIKLNYGQPDKKINLFADVNMLEEIRGQGTNELRHFTSICAGMDINVNKFFDKEKIFKITAGIKMENTTRKGDTISKVDLKANLIDVGLQYEFAKKFDLLLGAKLLNANGNEFLPVRDNMNRINDFTPVTMDCKEILLGGGIRYRFSEQSYLTLQYLNFDYKDNKTNANNYNINQVIILYSMKF